ncbi:hypothetical protein PYW07_016077 [Mythimna separata]|uniref:Malate dehydrogenase, mitochondrial n=1 Tax=Mythimna separata TaxID=271217 RepID=A0AAD7YQG3_MYTSE|nr:hypothetical protein PYW07_016077 [Mythimna separata]
MNQKIERLQLYDTHEKIIGAAMALNHLPGGPIVSGFAGEKLGAAVRSSELILTLHRVPRKPGNKREDMIAANALLLQKVCRAMADENPNAFLAIATNPINSMVPFASSILYKYGIYNPFKVFGITQIDIARTRTYTAEALQVSNQNLFVPVIGGHSAETIIPLFSYMTPVEHVVNPCQADTLTQFVRKLGTEIVFQKQGSGSAVVGVAHSINEFCDTLIDAINGKEVEATCYSANPYFGSRFFAGPATIGPYGIVQPFRKFPFNDYETFLVNSSVPFINRDVNLGEDYVKVLLPKL